MGSIWGVVKTSLASWQGEDQGHGLLGPLMFGHTGSAGVLASHENEVVPGTVGSVRGTLRNLPEEFNGAGGPSGMSGTSHTCGAPSFLPRGGGQVPGGVPVAQQLQRDGGSAQWEGQGNMPREEAGMYGTGHEVLWVDKLSGFQDLRLGRAACRVFMGDWPQWPGNVRSVDLPALPELSESEVGPLIAGDWLTTIGPLLRDMSASSSLWWDETMRVAGESYQRWLAC